MHTDLSWKKERKFLQWFTSQEHSNNNTSRKKINLNHAYFKDFADSRTTSINSTYIYAKDMKKHFASDCVNVFFVQNILLTTYSLNLIRQLNEQNILQFYF